MKRILTAISFIAIICSCGGNANQQKGGKYSLTVGYVNKLEEKIELNPERFEAANDTAAYLYALNKLESLAEDPHSALVGSSGKDYPFYPTYFELKDAKGNEIIIEGVETEKMKAQREKAVLEQKKAFAGAEFGMSPQEILALDYYKGWYKKTDFINKAMVPIGNEKYNVYLYFDNDALYSMTFSSVLYRSANHLDNEIAKEVKNFKDVIVQAYGQPTKDYGIPSIFSLKSGFISWAYVWEIGTKTISVGIEESSYSPEYRMHAEIKNTEVTDRLKAEKESTKRDKIEESSSLF